MLLTHGSRLGPYEILAPLGAGGMGEVYRARDSRLERDVALKILPPGLASEPDALARFEREAKAVAALSHPNILAIYDFGQADGRHYAVMELLEGRTLRDLLGDGSLSPDKSIEYARQLVEGLAAAHSKGIVHRDLKPENLFVTHNGHVKILDFGLAKRTTVSSTSDRTRADTMTSATMQGTVLGTLGYMPPEQLHGQPVDQRADVFAFGAVFYEMLTGQRAFAGTSDAAVMVAILKQDPPTLSSLGRDASPALEAIVQRCLSKNPAARFASAHEVLVALNAAASRQPRLKEQPRARRRWVRWALALCAIGIAVPIIAFNVGGLRERLFSLTSAPQIRSLAVLPLDNYSGDPSQEFFVEGMTDELTANLAIISKLRVISRGSATQFKGKRRPPMQEIANVLNVDAVVEGSVTRVGDKVRITAQLIDARSDRHLWARTFERSSSDVLALQADLASAIASEINVQLTPTEQSRLAATPRVNPEAHDAYLKGRYFFNRPSDENLKKAIEQFEEAITLSPDFAPAYSGLSDASLWAGYNEGFLTASEARPRAKGAAEKAVQLDANSAEAHTSLAVFKLFYEYDWPGCEREFRRAIALNPSYAFAHDQFGMALAFQGRIDEAIAEGKIAAELDPLSPQISIDAAMAFMFRGDNEAAKSLARKAADLDPTYFFPPMMEGWADCEAGRFGDAIPALKRAKAMESPAFVTAWLAYAYGASGDGARAKTELEDLRKKSLHGQVAPFNLALVYLGLGDRPRTMAYLEQALAADSQWLGWLRNDRIFDPLRSEPRFVALLRKLGFER